MKKKLLVLMTCLALISMMVVPAMGEEAAIKVEVNGTLVAFDVQPYVNADNRTLVPLRAPMEALGAEVSWDDVATATITKGDIVVAFTVDQKSYTVNGEAKEMDTAAVMKDGRVLIPIKFAAEALGATVEWNGETSTVIITLDEEPPVEEPPVEEPPVEEPPVENPPVENPPVENPPAAAFDIANVVGAYAANCAFEFTGTVDTTPLAGKLNYNAKGTSTLTAAGVESATFKAEIQTLMSPAQDRTVAALPLAELMTDVDAAKAVIKGFTVKEEGSNWVVTVKGSTLPASVITLFNSVKDGVTWKAITADLVITVDKATNKISKIDITNLKGTAHSNSLNKDLPADGQATLTFTY